MDDRINIISGNPFVEVTKGVIHLYKLSEPVPDTKMMAMLGVPANHKTPDLLQLTAPCHQVLEYIRIIHPRWLPEPVHGAAKVHGPPVRRRVTVRLPRTALQLARAGGRDC
jgi:hypothetical protein